MKVRKRRGRCRESSAAALSLSINVRANGFGGRKGVEGDRQGPSSALIQRNFAHKWLFLRHKATQQNSPAWRNDLFRQAGSKKASLKRDAFLLLSIFSATRRHLELFQRLVQKIVKRLHCLVNPNRFLYKLRIRQFLIRYRIL